MNGETMNGDQRLRQILRAAVRRQCFAQIATDERVRTSRVNVYRGKSALRDRWLFGVIRLNDRWYLLPRGGQCFEIRISDDVVPIAEWLMDMAVEGCEDSKVLKRLGEHSSLSVSPDYWAQQWQAKMLYCGQFGWQEISRGENDVLDLWNDVSRQFGFPFDTLRFPSGFRTWNVSRWFEISPGVRQPSVRAYRKGIVDALCAATAREEIVLVMDWQHPCYFFDAHRMSCPDDDAAWPISLDSDGDPILLTSQDYRLGLFADVSDHSITIWGEKFLFAVLAQLPEFLADAMQTTAG